MLTSSPSATPSGKSSPHAFRARCYQQSCRSSSQMRDSPRIFTPTAPTPRRHDFSPSLAPAPVSAHSSSVRRQTRDVGTQYSPPERMQTQTVAPTAASSETTAYASSPDSTTKRKRASGGTPVVRDTPPTPTVRVDPRPKDPVPVAAKPPSPEKNVIGGGEEVPDRAPKRQSASDKSIKVMPLNYEDCDPKDLGVLISGLLIELVNINDSVPLKDGQLTRFHSRAPPAISVQDYLRRIIVHATLSPPILLAMVYYIDRLCALYPTFTISSLTVHRFLIAAATAGSKGLSDSFWTNKTYAMVGGVSQKELAILELDFLVRLEWRIVPKPEVLVDYYKNLVERGDGYVLESEDEAGQEMKVEE